MRFIGEPQSRRRELLNYLLALPAYPLRNFLQILCTINYFINGEKVDVSDLYIQKAELLDSYAEINRLLSHGVYDFTRRVAEADPAERQSVVIHEAKRYLLDHIGENVPLA